MLVNSSIRDLNRIRKDFNRESSAKAPLEERKPSVNMSQMCKMVREQTIYQQHLIRCDTRSLCKGNVDYEKD